MHELSIYNVRKDESELPGICFDKSTLPRTTCTLQYKINKVSMVLKGLKQIAMCVLSCHSVRFWQCLLSLCALAVG